MRIALIGLDDRLLQVAAAAAEAGHVVVQAYDVGKRLPQLLQVAPHVVVGDAWESMLVDKSLDLIVVGTGAAEVDAEDPVRPADLREEQLRRFVQEGIPTIILPFACDLDQGYELEMYRREQNGVLTTWLEDWNHPGYRWLQALLQEADTSPLGTVQQVRWDALLPQRDRATVLRQFVNDLAHIRQWLGPIETVLATGGPGETHYDPFAPKKDLQPLDQLTVHLGTRSQRTAVWSVVPGGGMPQGRIAVLGSGGQAVLHVGASQTEWEGELQVGSVVEKIRFAPASANWEALVSSDRTGEESVPAWIDSCRDLEVVEAIDRSLLRGRTVAVHAEETSESDAFKGMMASGGCVVLTMVLFALFVVVMVEGLRLPVREWPLWKAWPIVLVGLIVLFLGLQSLNVLVARPVKKGPNPDGEP